MSIASAITAAQGKVANCYTAISNKGGTLPATQNLANMPEAINSISGGGGGGSPSVIYYYPNYTVVGSPTISNNFIANGFSDSNYLKTGFIFAPTQPWEISLVCTPNTNNDWQKLTGGSADFVMGHTFGIGATNVLQFEATTNGTSWDINLIDPTPVTTGTTYYIKYGWTGSVYYLDKSLDGTTYTRVATTNKSNPIVATGELYIGKTWLSSHYWRGSIDLIATKITVNGSDFWSATKSEYMSNIPTYYNNYTVVGSPTISINNVASNFSGSDYVKSTSPLAQNTNGELVIKIKTPNSIGTADYPIVSFGTGSSAKDIFLQGSTKTVCQWDGSHFVGGTNALSANTEYTIKVVYDGSYKLYVDDVLEYTTSYPIINTGDMSFGIFPGNTSQYWVGEIYLRECYIKSNNETIWEAVQTYYVGGIPRQTYFTGTYTRYSAPQISYSFILPPGTDSIGSYGLANAFRGSNYLIGVDLSNIKDIQTYGLQYAFASCAGLKGTIDLSALEAVSTYALNYAFQGCTGITGINLSGLATITTTRALANAFYGCSGLTSVNLSSFNNTGATGTYGFIGAFYNCTGLTTISFPALKNIASQYLFSTAFRGCTSLTTADFSSLLTVSAQRAFDNAFYGDTALTAPNFSKLTSITGTYAFYQAFYGCTGLTSMTFNALATANVASIFSYAFQNCTGLRTLSFPALTTFGSSTNQFNNMLYGCSNVTVHFKSSVQSTIGSWSDVTAGFGGTNTTVLFDL